jgi:hypothetical protein
MFFTFSQNNSGGGFDFDEKVSEYVIIEADSPELANERAEEIGIYFDGCDSELDCPCCGDRWCRVSNLDGTEVPEIYGKNPQDVKTTFVNFVNVGGVYCYVYYKNGTVEEYRKPVPVYRSRKKA